MIKIELTLDRSAFDGQPILTSKVVSVDVDESPEIEKMATSLLQFNGRPVIYKEQIQLTKPSIVSGNHKFVEKHTKQNLIGKLGLEYRKGLNKRNHDMIGDIVKLVKLAFGFNPDSGAKNGK